MDFLPKEFLSVEMYLFAQKLRFIECGLRLFEEIALYYKRISVILVRYSLLVNFFVRHKFSKVYNGKICVEEQ